MLPAIHSLHVSGANRNEEVVAPILQGLSFRAEHISSFGVSSPHDFWYDQNLPEWVALLQGTASIEFEEGTLHLKAGDYLIIPQHLKHRVSVTSPDASWLAIHFEPEQGVTEHA